MSSWLLLVRAGKSLVEKWFFKRKQHASNFWILWSCCSIKSYFLVQRIASKFHKRLEFWRRQVADFYKEKIFHLMKGREITVVYWSDLCFVLTSAGSNKVRFFWIPLSDCCPVAQSSNEICPPVAGHTHRPVSLSWGPPKASYFSLVSGWALCIKFLMAIRGSYCKPSDNKTSYFLLFLSSPTSKCVSL